MDPLQLTQTPTMRTGMLIRRPAAEVFAALVDPAITTRFWFTRGSGRLDQGQQVEWFWDMYNVSAVVTPQLIEADRRIVIEWPGYSGPTTVEWRLRSQPDGTTFVEVTESGFAGDGDALVQQVADSTQGFALMLAGMKAWLEHGIALNLVADRYPAGLEAH